MVLSITIYLVTWLLGYRVPSDRVAGALIEKYGRWPKANVFEDEMRGVRYFSDKKIAGSILHLKV